MSKGKGSFLERWRIPGSSENTGRIVTRIMLEGDDLTVPTRILLVGADEVTAQNIRRDAPNTEIIMVEKDQKEVKRIRGELSSQDNTRSVQVVRERFPGQKTVDVKADYAVTQHIAHFGTDEEAARIIHGAEDRTRPGGHIIVTAPRLADRRTGRRIDRAARTREVEKKRLGRGPFSVTAFIWRKPRQR